MQLRFLQKNQTYHTDHKEYGEWTKWEHVIEGNKVLQYRDGLLWKDVPLVIEVEKLK